MKILVVDDEPLARERLMRLLAKLEPTATCYEAADGREALVLIARENPELVLLDVRMPGVDGIEVAAELDGMPAPPAVIFCTAYDEYALEALRHQAVAYVLKPVREAELARALESAGRVNRIQLAQLAREQEVATGMPRQSISCHTHRGFETLPVTEIRCFLAEQKYVSACGPDRELLIPDTLKDLEQEFSDLFVRVHRNALVALEHIQRLERDDEGGWHVVLRGVSYLPSVSRRHLGAVKKRLSQH